MKASWFSSELLLHSTMLSGMNHGCNQNPESFGQIRDLYESEKKSIIESATKMFYSSLSTIYRVT